MILFPRVASFLRKATRSFLQSYSRVELWHRQTGCVDKKYGSMTEPKRTKQTDLVHSMITNWFLLYVFQAGIDVASTCLQVSYLTCYTGARASSHSSPQRTTFSEASPYLDAFRALYNTCWLFTCGGPHNCARSAP